MNNMHKNLVLMSNLIFFDWIRFGSHPSCVPALVSSKFTEQLADLVTDVYSVRTAMAFVYTGLHTNSVSPAPPCVAIWNT